jgi:ATP-binding cassette subfamily B protein
MNISKTKWPSLLFYPGAYPVIGVILTCFIFSSIFGMFVPHFIQNLSASYSTTSLFYESIYKLLILFTSIYFVRAIYEYGVNRYIKEVIQSVRSKCFQDWILSYEGQMKDHSIKDRYPQGEVIARIMNDTEAIRELITSGSFGVILDFFFVISCLIGLVRINKITGLFLGLSILGAVFFLIWGSKYMRYYFHSVRYSRGMVSRTIANVVGGIRESFFTKHGNYASKKGEHVFIDYLHKILKANVWDAGFYSLAESLYPIFLVLVVVIFPFSSITSIAVVLAVIDIIQRSIQPVKNIASRMANLQRAVTGFQRIFEFVDDLNTRPLAPLSDGEIQSIPLKSLKVSIREFRYPEPEVKDLKEEKKSFALSNVNFDVYQNQMIGIVGTSGCGKSTVLNILAGNIIPDSFDIELNFDLNETFHFGSSTSKKLSAYREYISIISQDSHIFTETLFFNISLSTDKSEDLVTFWKWISERIVYLKRWGILADDIIKPASLSLGQKQLISAIRACYLKKTIVLFDEISSSLDSELELALREVIKIVQQNSMTIIVTHRLETLLESNKIIVMEDGKIIGEGGHSELLKSTKKYQLFIDELTGVSRAPSV